MFMLPCFTVYLSLPYQVSVLMLFKNVLFKNVSSSHRMTRRGFSNADILNLQNDALVAELFGTELNCIDVC